MTGDFRMGLVSQQEWSWLVATDLFLSGLGGALFLLFEIFSLGPGVAVIALVLVVLGAIVLLTELGRPLRAWRAILRPQTSWITRGVIFVTVFLVCGVLYIAPSLPFLSWLPWAVGGPVDNVLGVLAGVAAVLVMLYPGFVLSASPAISLWNNALLPFLFVSYSAMGACGVVLLLSAIGLLPQEMEAMRALAAILIGTNLALIAIYLATLSRSGLSAKEALRLLNEGKLGLIFKLGVVLVGMIIPLLAVALVPAAAGLAGILILVGALLFRYCVLKAGVYAPFPLS